MRLYFLRHAPALSREEWGASDDLRPLSAKGEDVARAVAARIADLDLGLAAIITSPYERALRTAAEVADALKGEVPLVEDPRLEPESFSVRSLATLLAEYSDASAIMLVGHEPSMSDVLSAVVGGGRFTMKKGGLARVDLGLVSPPRGALAFLVPPKALTEG